MGRPVQLVDLLVAQDRLATDRVLKSFERRLQTLYARVKSLHPTLPTVRLSHYRLCAWRLAAIALVATGDRRRHLSAFPRRISSSIVRR